MCNLIKFDEAVICCGDASSQQNWDLVRASAKFAILTQMDWKPGDLVPSTLYEAIFGELESEPDSDEEMSESDLANLFAESDDDEDMQPATDDYEDLQRALALSAASYDNELARRDPWDHV